MGGSSRDGRKRATTYWASREQVFWSCQKTTERLDDRRRTMKFIVELQRDDGTANPPGPPTTDHLWSPKCFPFHCQEFFIPLRWMRDKVPASFCRSTSAAQPIPVSCSPDKHFIPTSTTTVSLRFRDCRCRQTPRHNGTTSSSLWAWLSSRRVLAENIRREPRLWQPDMQLMSTSNASHSCVNVVEEQGVCCASASVVGGRGGFFRGIMLAAG
ncbi:hypothetical protein IWX49DRAFT_129235 [Phyllosticta citricarpa]|uniref:Uncharacterized protein n=1 Tax=Phyllosticta citricarpa TaxID=55181 RepID=A0ABR1ML86_9PEZI